MMTVALFVAGLVLLILGAEALVRGASRAASALGVSPLVIGLTVVAFGTSSPELAVNVEAALSNQGSVGLGNVVGSNIFNVLLVLGASALVTPLVVSQKLVRLDVPFMIVVSLAAWWFASDGRIDGVDGLILLAGFLGYGLFLAWETARKGAGGADDSSGGIRLGRLSAAGWLVNAGLVAGGLWLLVVGSEWLVDAATLIARRVGLSELVVGLTIVAAGTSLPELATSVIASLKGERDIAVGNVVGSNLFNLMAVLGVTSLLAPTGIEVAPAAINFDMPVMAVVAFACLPIFFTGGVISRWEGALLLVYYVMYTLYLLIGGSHHDAVDTYGLVIAYAAIPLTLVTLVVLAALELRRRKT